MAWIIVKKRAKLNGKIEDIDISKYHHSLILKLDRSDPLVADLMHGNSATDTDTPLIIDMLWLEAHSIFSRPTGFARGCFTNTAVIHSLIKLRSS